MIYSDFKGDRISKLAFGAMRLPVADGDDSKPIQEKVDALVDEAMKEGINYYDTAWGYHGGNSETVMGKALSKYPRDSYFLADKFPGYDVANMGHAKEIFQKQLEKTGAEYFDYYLVHNVCETNIEQYLDPKYGDVAFLIEMRKQGKIRHLGFSCHSNFDNLKRFVEAYGKDMEFVQLQINYLDWMFQEGKKKVDYATEHNLPIWVMEPLRGGSLAKLDDKYMKELEAAKPGEIPVGWCFRFLQSIPQVVTVLSGMTEMQQMKDKIALFEKNEPLTEHQLAVLQHVADEMASVGTVPCTACKYCITHCPKHIVIPEVMRLYNEDKLTNGGFIAFMGYEALAVKPTECIACRRCEKVCPQTIKISEIMKDFAARHAKGMFH